MIIFFALMLLLSYDGPRLAPPALRIPVPWAEQGNRRARRRDAKLARAR